MMKLKIVKQGELAFKKEKSVYCDFCGDKDKIVFTSSYDEGEDHRKCETQVCEDCVRQPDGTYKKQVVITKPFGVRYNLWTFDTGKGKSTKDTIAFSHPATFSDNLAEDHILSWSNGGDTVLDPMCGSGTTLKMAKKNGRNYIGIEISEEYCEISRNRLSN